MGFPFFGGGGSGGNGGGIGNLTAAMLGLLGINMAGTAGLEPKPMQSSVFSWARPGVTPTWRPNLQWSDVEYVRSRTYMRTDPNAGSDVTNSLQEFLLECYLIAKGLKNSAWDDLLCRQRVKAITPRGKYNVYAPIVIPPFVDWENLGSLIRRYDAAGNVATWNGSPTQRALGNNYQPTVILTPASCLTEMNLNCDGEGDETKAGAGIVSGKTWGVATVGVADGGTGYAPGQVLYGANPDKGAYVGFKVTVATVDGNGKILTVTLTDPGSYAFPVELQKKVWTEANGFDGATLLGSTGADRVRVFAPNGTSYYAYGTSGGLPGSVTGTGATFDVTWAPDFVNSVYAPATYAVGDALIGTVRIHGCPTSLPFDATYGGIFGFAFRGLNHWFDRIEIAGGYNAFDVTNCNDVFGTVANNVCGKRGMNIFLCGNLNIAQVVLDSCLSSSFVMDRSGNVTLPAVNIFWSEGNRSQDANAPATSGYNIQVGTQSNSQKNYNCSANFIVNRGGRNSPASSPLAKFDGCRGCTFSFNAPNATNAGVLAYGSALSLTHLADVGAGFDSSNTILGSMNEIPRRMFSGIGLYRKSDALFTGTIAGTVLTVTGIDSGTIAVDQLLQFPGFTAGTKITSLGTGTGGVGTYNINTAHTVATARKISAYLPFTFTGSVSGTTLTVSDTPTGTLKAGMMLEGTGVFPGTTILSQLSGTTGGVGTYQVSNVYSVASTTITASFAETAPRCNVDVWDDAGQGRVRMGGIYEISGQGAPTTDTGLYKAVPGSIYINLATGDRYTQVGSVEDPDWRLSTPVTCFPTVNLIPAPRAFGTGVWQVTGATVVDAQSAGSDGKLRNALVTFAATSNFVRSASINLTATGKQLFSLVVKAGTAKKIRLFCGDSGQTIGFQATFDCTNGFSPTAASAVGTGRILNYGVIPLGNGFFRIWIYGVFGTAGGARMHVLPSTTSGDLGTVLIDQAQLEQNGNVQPGDFAEFVGFANLTVATSAVTIAHSQYDGEMFTVSGSASAGTIAFMDVIVVSPTRGPIVVFTDAGLGTPAARTYSISAGSIQLAMASGSYTVTARRANAT